MIVALINDATFDEPHVVVGGSYEDVARAIVAYLRVTRPMCAATGERLVVQHGAESYLGFLEKALPDLEDLDVQMYPAQDTGEFLAWCSRHTKQLGDNHRQMTETIKIVGNLI